MNTPDWNKLSELNPTLYHQLAGESWKQQVLIMYQEVVLNPDADNTDINSSFMVSCEKSKSLKGMFFTWLDSYEEREDSPVTYQEVLKFINYLSWCEERHVQRLKNKASKV